MISGMRSLSTTHEQIVVAWTGDVLQEYAKDSKRTVPSTPVRPTPKRLQSIAGTAPGRDTPAQPDMSIGTSIASTPLAQPEVEEERPVRMDEQPSVYMAELTEEEQKGLERELHKFSDHEVKNDNAGRMTYAPVFVPRGTAKGHYEGYCKTSEWDDG